MAVRIKASGEVMRGTVEILRGVAFVDSVDAAGRLQYAGETDIDWDSQTTQVRDGKTLWIGEGGDLFWLLPEEIENVPEDTL